MSSFRDTKLPVYLGLADESKGFSHQGHLDFLDNRMDRKTDTMRGRAILPNSDLTLTPGLFAKVWIPGSGRYEAILIPDSAIGTDQSEKFVFVVDCARHDSAAEGRARPPRPRAAHRPRRPGGRGTHRAPRTPAGQARRSREATYEETTALEDGPPDDAQPLPEGRWGGRKLPPPPLVTPGARRTRRPPRSGRRRHPVDSILQIKVHESLGRPIPNGAVGGMP